MLTPEKIQQANQLTGFNVPPTGQAPVQSRVQQLQAEKAALKAQATQPEVPPEVAHPQLEGFKGVAKGAASTFLATPAQAGLKIFAAGAGKAAKDTGRTEVAPVLKQAEETDALIKKYASLPAGDPQKATLEAQIRENLNRSTEHAKPGIEDIGQKALDTSASKESLGKALGNENLFTPTNINQKIGYGAEQIAEYAIPAAKISKAEKLLDIATQGMSKFGGAATRVAGKAALEGAGAAGVALAQTGDVKKAAKVGVTAGIISGIVRTAGEAARALGIPEKLYSKIFKQNYQDMKAQMNSEGMRVLQEKNPEKFKDLVSQGILKVGKDGNPVLNESTAKMALNTGLAGDLQHMANTVVENKADYESAARSLAAGHQGTIAVDQKPITSVLMKVAEAYDGVGSGELSNKALELAAQIESSSGKLTGEQALDARRLFDSLRAQSSYNQPAPHLSLTAENFKFWSDKLRQQLAENIPGMADVMKNYSFNIDAAIDLAKAAAKQGNKAALGLIDSMFLGESLLTKSPVGAIVGLANKAIQQPALRTDLAQAINSPAAQSAAGAAIQGGAARGVTEAINR